MKLLLDTHLLLWAANADPRLPAEAAALIAAPSHDLLFSAASLWEIAIKAGLSRPDFKIEPRLFHRGLVDNGFEELAINSEHALLAGSLPSLHKDPFDRLLVAQATVEAVVLLTADPMIATYPGPIRLV